MHEQAENPHSVSSLEITTRGRGRGTYQHDLDVLRAGLMLLGIPYHAAYVYTGRPWFVACSDRSEGLRIFGDLVHLFRMQAFFLVAGLLTAQILARRTPTAYLASRFKRLGIPLIAVAVLINPLGPIFHQVVMVFRGMEPSSAVLRLANFYPRVDHLWFLIVLLYFSTAAAVLVKLVPWQTLKEALPTRDIDRHVILMLLSTCAVIGIYQWLSHRAIAPMDARFGAVVRALQIDRAVEYVPYFAFGMLLGTSPRANAAICRPRVALLALAIVSVCVTLPLVNTNARGLEITANAQLVSAFSALLCTQVLLSLARRYGSRPNFVVDVLARASFTMYLLHFPIIIVFQEAFVAFGTAIPISLVVTTVSTTLISFAAWTIFRPPGLSGAGTEWVPQTKRI